MISIGVKHQEQTKSSTHQPAIWLSLFAFPSHKIKAVLMDMSVVVKEG